MSEETEGGDPESRAGSGERADERPPTGRADRRRLFLGGFGVIGAVLGYLAVRVLVDAGAFARQTEVLALPVFGVVGAIGFVLFVSAFLAE